MRGSSVHVVAALSILSAGWLMTGRAEAGGAASAPSKSSHEVQTAAVSHGGTVRHVRHETLGITEFSSSSATNYPQPPKR